MKYYNVYDKKPPKVFTKLDTETCLVSQSEIVTSSLQYQLHRYGMDSLSARLEQMRDKFGYADCTVNNDFATLQNRYRQSVDYFEALPSEIRAKYHHRPEEFYDDIQKDPKVAYEHNFISKEKFDELTNNMPVQAKSSQVDLQQVENNTSTVSDAVESQTSA